MDREIQKGETFPIFPLEMYLAYSIAIRDQPGILRCSLLLGHSYTTLGDYQKAIEYFEKYLEICTKTGDVPGIATANAKLGDSYLRSADYEKAVKFLTNSLEIFIHIGHRSGIAKTNAGLGAAHSSLGDFQKAIDCCKKSLEISATIGDQSIIAQNNGNLGNAYRGLRENNMAIDYYNKALEISTSIGDQSGIARFNDELGNTYLRSGEYHKAIEYSKKGLEINTSISNQIGIATTNSNLGNAYFSLGECKKSIDHFQKGLKIYASIGDQSGLACSYENMGNAYLSVGEYYKSIDYSKKGLEIFASIGDQSRIAGTNRNLGNAYVSLGEYDKAIDYYKKGLEISTSIGDQLGIARANGNLGGTYLWLGDYNEAIGFSKKGLEISAAIGDQLGIAGNNGNLGKLYRCLGECSKAIDYYKKSLEMFVSIGDQSGIAKNNESLGNAYLSLEKYDKAIKYYEKGLIISTSIDDQPVIASINCNLGYAYSLLGKYDKAIDYCKKSLEFSIAIHDPMLLAFAYSHFGHIYQCSGKHEDAVVHLMQCISCYDTIFLKSVPDQNKLLYAMQYFTAHKELMSCFISLEHIQSGLLVVDLGRAKELHNSIERKQNPMDEEKSEMFAYATATWRSINSGEEEPKGEIEKIQKILQVGRDGTTILVFAFDLDDFLNAWILNGDVVFRKSNARLGTFVQLISKLFARVNVKVSRDSSFFKPQFVGSFDPQYSFEMLRKKSESNRSPGITPNNGDVNNETILQELFQLLIKPVRDAVDGNKIIVVPDSQLFFVPFPALIDENDCHLSRNYSIQITPSLHTLKFSMEQSGEKDFGFGLFVGNPDLGNPIYDLPNATEEVESLSKLFEARPLVGHEARKHVVLELLSGASIIHIAAHGEQTRGEIMLSPDAPTTQPVSSLPNQDDYLLTQQDITNISLKAHLVVLCCCHTGQGDISSEGVIGIARAFLAAGARSVLATLWPINDVATKEFMEVFYCELCLETSACEALRRAMNLFRKHKNETYRSFETWAPFTIYGEDVIFQRHDIEKIKEKSREMFSDFFVLPKSS